VIQKVGRHGEDYFLTAEQVEQYRRDGYLTLREVMTEEELRAVEPDFQRFIPLRRGDMTVHDERIVHGSSGNQSKDRWRRTYIVAFRHEETVEYERSTGFNHSHNDKINWQTHLGALEME
jgi:ectoine hydroxylase-related dioxygenase (phytanoyl-CoA dioxygenase family)